MSKTTHPSLGKDAIVNNAFEDGFPLNELDRTLIEYGADMDAALENSVRRSGTPEKETKESLAAFLRAAILSGFAVHAKVMQQGLESLAAAIDRQTAATAAVVRRLEGIEKVLARGEAQAAPHPVAGQIDQQSE